LKTEAFKVFKRSQRWPLNCSNSGSTMKRLLVITCALFSLGASAQSFVFRLPSDTTSTSYTYGAGNCGDSITMSWSYVLPISGQPTDSFQVWSTRDSSCATAPGTNDQVLATVNWLVVNSTKSGNFTVKLSSLPSFVGDGGTSCPAPNPTSLTDNLCGSMPYVLGTIGGSTQYARATAFPLTYDTLPPTIPTIESTVAQDSAVGVTFSANDADTVTITLEVMGPSDPDWRTAGTAIVANTSQVRGTGLVNGQTYQVRIRAVDAAGNVSDPTAAVSVTPIDTIGFFGYYAQNGGELDGGCATAPGLMTLLLAAFALRPRRMKR
jgi:hypothetical protein